MVVQELLALLPNELPDEIASLALVVCMIGTLIGAALWLAGSCFSRSLITLSTVSLGTTLGMCLPRWMGWTIDGMAPAVGGAVILGVSGYVLHRVWVGIGLGLVLSCWAALATWVFCHGESAWAWPTIDVAMTVLQVAQQIWLALPEAVSRVLPYVCGAAMLSGLASALLWPRVGVVLLYSLMGVSLLLSAGLTAMRLGYPDWIALVPSQSSSQVSVVLGLVVLGALVQWWLSPAPAEAGAQAKNSSSDDDE